MAGIVPEISSSALTQTMLPIASQFQAPSTSLQVMITVSKLMLASLVLTGGRLGDIYGRQKILMIGTIGMGCAALLCAMSTSMNVVILARALDGIFSSLVIPLALALLVLSVDPKDLAVSIGYYLSFVGIAALTIPYLSATLVQIVTWRVVFLILAAIAFLATTFLWRTVSFANEQKVHSKLDLVGSLLCVLGLSAFIYGLIQSNPLGWRHPAVWEFVCAGVLIVGIFVIWELRTSNPLIDFSLFRNKVFTIAILSGMVIPFVGAGLSIPLLNYFRLVHDDSAALSTLQLMPLALATTLVSPIAGKAGLKMSPRIMITFGLILMAAGAFGLSFISASTSYILLIGPMLLIGSGVAFAITSRTQVVMGSVAPQFSGAASGVNTASGKLGSALGTAMVSTFFIAFGKMHYAALMSHTRLSTEQIRDATLAWRAARNASSLDTLDLPQSLIWNIETNFKAAYAYGLAKSELAACLLLLLCAVGVWFTLRNQSDVIRG